MAIIIAQNKSRKTTRRLQAISLNKAYFQEITPCVSHFDRGNQLQLGSSKLNVLKNMLEGQLWFKSRLPQTAVLRPSKDPHPRKKIELAAPNHSRVF
jgi:hypothetical protein